PLDGLQCETCSFITVNKDAMRMYCKKTHQQAWVGEKSLLYKTVKVQSFFRTGGLQKYFIVNLVDAGNTENDEVENIVQAQLAEYRSTQQEIEEELQTLEAAAKIDKTGWFKRTGWLEFLKDRNLAHLAHQARAPDHSERKIKLAAELAEGLIERSMKGLATLTQELRRWLRSAKREEPDVRPLARLQNPESQAVYASYMVRFVCFYLRILANEEQRIVRFREQQNEAAYAESRSASGSEEDSEEDDDGDTLEALLLGSQRSTQTEQDRDRFVEMRQKYLADGSFSPMSEMISMLAYGKHIGLSAGNSGNAHWSLDKKTFYLNSLLIAISCFRKMAQDLLAEAEHMLRELCWVDKEEDWVNVNLKQVVNDVTFTKQRMSFVDALGNKLQGGLDWMLSQVMAAYLVYMQLFKEYLTLQVLRGNYSNYVWHNTQGAWDTGQLTRILRRETGKRLGVLLHTLDYQHAAVGIRQVYVGELFSKGYQDKVSKIKEAKVEDNSEDLLELQNSRTTAIGVGNYSVLMDIVKHLSVRLIDAFWALSMAWHGFLGVDESAAKYAGPSRTAKRLMSISMSSGLAKPLKEKEVRVADPQAEAIQQGLQQVLGKQDQEQALHAVLEKQTPLIVVLLIGRGKSLLFTLLACVEGPGVTVVIVLYQALIKDLVGRIQRCGVECMEWKHGESNLASVVVVSADVAGDITSAGNFLWYARMLKAKGLLHWIVIDECYLVLTARDWREKLLAIKNLRLVGSPIVMLTATLPPLQEGEFEASMLVRHATYIRASTMRPNARYFVSWCQGDKLEETALFMCKRWAEKLRQSGQKGVVYCKSKKQCEKVAKELGCAHYPRAVVGISPIPGR
ncbi:hypothetical protein SLS61_010262, partial [Didymella pomorum]